MDLSAHTSLAGLAEAIAAVQAAASRVGCDMYKKVPVTLIRYCGRFFGRVRGHAEEEPHL